jgi:hypothetical protein
MVADGTTQGMSIPLSWDPETLEPTDYLEGDLLAAQGGESVVLSPTPGTLDMALLGIRDRGIAGEGVLATLRFKVLQQGDYELEVREVSARDSENKAHSIDTEVRAGTPDQLDVPKVSFLENSYPNPFNPQTTLAYGVAIQGPVTIKVYSVDGRLVKTLLNEVRGPGSYKVIWDGTDNRGQRVASGMYMARLQALDNTQLQRMMLVK